MVDARKASLADITAEMFVRCLLLHRESRRGAIWRWDLVLGRLGRVEVGTF